MQATRRGHSIRSQCDALEELRTNGMPLIALSSSRRDAAGFGAALVAALRRMGYETVRQHGSHVRVTTQQGSEHHEVIPLHVPIRAKTLSSILKIVARNHGIRVEELRPAGHRRERR